MCFNFFSFAALAALATTIGAQTVCPDASRFGVVTVSPSTVASGQTFTITANLTCAVQLDDTPTYLDYYIVGSATHAIPGPILIARRTYDNTTSPPIDQFTAVLPNYFYSTDAGYSLMMENSFARPGPTGESVITVGGIGTGITIPFYYHPTADATKCLSAVSNTDGAAVEIQECDSVSATSQSWSISGSNLQIFGDKCLDVTNGATTDGTKMQIWTCAAGNTNQMWTVSENTIQWNGHSLCLDLTGGSVTVGNLIQIWGCTDGPNQQWTPTTLP